MPTISPLASSKQRERIFDASICISVYGKSIPDLNRNVGRALSFYPGYVELRLDYLRPFPKTVSQFSKLRHCINEILTFRARSEGGVSAISDQTRIQILEEVISKISPPFIDIEAKTLESYPGISIKLQGTRTKLIASSHDFSRIESTRELERLVFRTVELCSPSIIKIVRNARSFDDNLRILSLYRLLPELKPTRLVAFCTGSLGIFSRIACIGLGSPFSFASLPGKITAPGQLDISSMKAILSSMKANQRQIA